MLVLSRKVGEKIVIGDNVTIVVQRIGKGRVALAIEAPHEVPVLRGELAPFGLEIDGEGPVQFEDLLEDGEASAPVSEHVAANRGTVQNKSQFRSRSTYPRSAAPLNPTPSSSDLRVSQSAAAR